MKLITRHIPNTITCCNLISGCIASYQAFEGNIWMALTFIIIGAVFDFFDGFAARLLQVSSPIGKELDSLADVVTFGVAPSAIVFYTLQDLSCTANSLLPYLAFLIAAFSALRLAKFNLDTRQATSFIGLPTPANALFWASFIIGYNSWMQETPWSHWLIIALILISCMMLVAEIPMFALKFKHYGISENKWRYLFLVVAIMLLTFCQVKGLALTIIWYIILSILTQRKTS